MADPAHFAWLEKVASAGSIRAAAFHLNVNPSSVSRKIVQFEQALGIKLVERVGTGIRLTDAGRLVVEYHREECKRFGELLKQLGDIRRDSALAIRIGVGQHYVDELIEAVIQDLMKEGPHYQFTVLTGGTQELVRMAIDGEVDFAIAYNPPDNSALRVNRSVRMPVRVITSPDHPLTRMERLTLADIHDYIVVTSSKYMGMGQVFEMAARDEHVEFPQKFITNSHSAVRQFVRKGLGVAFSTEYAFAKDLEEGSVKALLIDNERLNSGRVKLLTRVGHQFPPVVERTIRLVQSKLTVMKRHTNS